MINNAKEKLQDYNFFWQYSCVEFQSNAVFFSDFLHWMSDRYLFRKEFVVYLPSVIEVKKTMILQQCICFLLDSDFSNLRVWNDLRKIVILT